jgi:hypothetical protein
MKKFTKCNECSLLIVPVIEVPDIKTHEREDPTLESPIQHKSSLNFVLKAVNWSFNYQYQ